MESFHKRDLLYSLFGKILLLLNNLLPKNNGFDLAFVLYFGLVDLRYSRLKFALNSLKILEIILNLAVLFNIFNLRFLLDLFMYKIDSNLRQNCGVHITFSLARLIFFSLVFINFFNWRFLFLYLLWAE